MMPSLGLSEQRPTFVKFPGDAEKNLEEKSEFVVWVRVAGQDVDRCIPIYPNKGIEDQGAQNVIMFNCWNDYFSDIIDQWRDRARTDSSDAGGGWYKAGFEFGDWQLYGRD
jgi:hypothetical protein